MLVLDTSFFISALYIEQWPINEKERLKKVWNVVRFKNAMVVRKSQPFKNKFGVQG